MATNWSAYEAAKEIMGNNKENITDIGSRFPLFARTVSMVNSEYLLDILKALPKVTARVVESGLKDMETESAEETTDTEKEEPKKTEKKVTRSKKAAEKEEVEDDWGEDENTQEEEETKDYESMTAKELYALCCERGISSKCKDRKKTTLIKLLKETEGAKEEDTSDDDWDDDEEEEKPKKTEKDPYKGKTAKELFMMCKKRGITAAKQKEASYYAGLLKKADEAETEEEEDEDDDSDWEI